MQYRSGLSITAVAGTGVPPETMTPRPHKFTATMCWLAGGMNGLLHLLDANAVIRNNSLVHSLSRHSNTDSTDMRSRIITQGHRPLPDIVLYREVKTLCAVF